MTRMLKTIISGSVFLIIAVGNLTAQVTLYHVPPDPPTAGEPFRLEAVIFGKAPVINARLLHRVVGSASFQEVHMRFSEGTWYGIIPEGHVKEEGLEYAIIFTLTDFSAVAFPMEDPLGTPHLLPVEPAPYMGRVFENATESTVKLLEADVLIISPEEEEILDPDEVLIAVSLFSVVGLDLDAVKVFIDQEDITDICEITPEIIICEPSLLDAGIHTVNIELRNIYGYSLQPTTWSFTVAGVGSQLVTASEEFSYSGKIRSDFSLDQIDTETLGLGITNINLDGGWNWLRFKANLKLSTEESEFRQPRNRYSLSIKSGRNILVNLGDFTPVLSRYTIDGKRVRGFGIDINLNFLRFQLVNGQLERTVQGRTDSDASYVITDIKSQGTGLPLYYLDRVGYTFERSYQAYRLMLAYKNRFHLGLNFHKAKDEPHSVYQKINDAIFTVPNWANYVSETGIDSGEYTLSGFEAALEGVGEYILPSKDWADDDPLDNVVFGFDAGFAFDNRRLTFDVAWAMSLLNKNIWDGALTLAEMDTALDDSVDGFVGRLYDEWGAVTSLGFTLEDMMDPSVVQDFFIVNQYMTPLVPIDLELYEESPFQAYLRMPSSAYRMKFRAYYYENTFEMSYSQVGPEFISLANPYLTINVREFVISDLIRLLHNKLRLQVSYKYKDNKVLLTQTDPKVQGTTTMNFTFTPGIDLPSAVINLQSISRGNGKTLLDSVWYTSSTGEDSLALEDLREDLKTNNTLLSLSVPIRSGETKYQFTFTMSSILVEDQLAEERDEDFLSSNSSAKTIAFGTNIQFSKRLRTSINLSSYSFELPESMTAGEEGLKTVYTSLGLNSIYFIVPDKLKIMGGLNGLRATGISEFGNYGINGGVEWKPWKRLSAKAGFSVKANQSDSEFALGTLAVKFSVNYLF